MAVKVITYDVGTTGMKACLFDISAEESVKFIAGETDGYELHVMPNGGVEQDPEDWWQAMARATKKLLEKTGIPKEEIKALSFRAGIRWAAEAIRLNCSEILSFQKSQKRTAYLLHR